MDLPHERSMLNKDLDSILKPNIFISCWKGTGAKSDSSIVIFFIQERFINLENLNLNKKGQVGYANLLDIKGLNYTW